MKARFLAETLYSTLLTQIVPSISSTGNELDIFEIFVDSAPRYNSGWVILDFENKIKRDLIFFHNRVGNTLYYYRKDRDILGNGSINSQHQVQASVRMNDNAGWINHALSNVDDFGQIMKWGASNKIRVYGGKVTINESVVDVADSTITVPSGTKEVVLDYADNTIKIIDTSGLSTLVGQWLGTVVSSGSAITSVSDVRTAFAPLKINPAFFTYSGGKLVIATNAITTAQILDGSITISKMAANSVGTTQIVDQSIIYEKVGLEAIGILNMKPNSVGSNQIVPSSVTRSKIEADAIDSTKLADDAVGAEHIQAGAVGNSEIATNAVTPEKVATGAIEKDKIAANAVDGSKIEANAISQDKMADNSVGTAEIIDGNITKQKMAANSVGTSQLEDNSVTPAKIPDGSIPQSKLGADSVGQSQIQANAVGTDEIAPSAVGTSEIANSAVTQDKLAANSVGTSQIQNLSIITEKLVDLGVTAPKIADSAVVSRTIGAQQVLNTHIGIGEITSANIQNRTVTGTDIALSTIKGENIENGTITAEKLDAAITGLSLKVGLDSLDVAGAGYLLQKIKQGSGAVIQEVLDAGIRKLEISFNTGSLYVYTGSEGINVVGQDMRLGKALGAGGTAGQITTDREIVSNDKAILMSGQGAKFAVGYTSSDVIHSSLQGLSLATALLETATSITLGIQHSNVIATANNLVFTLPAAATCKGRSYTIGRKSVAYALLGLKTTDGALLYAFGSQNSNVTISGPDRTYACGNYPYVFSITSNGTDWMLTSSAIDDDDVSAAIALKEDSSNKSNSTADVASTTKFPTWGTISGWVSAGFATIASVALKANDSAVLHNTGNETSTGLKKFENIGVQSQTPGDTEIVFEIADSTNRWTKIRLAFKRYRGTLASKTNTVVGDVLGVIAFSGWNGADKNNGSMQVTDNGSRGKAAITNMDMEFDGYLKFLSMVMNTNANVDLTEGYGPNMRVGGNDYNYAMRIRKASGVDIMRFHGSGQVDKHYTTDTGSNVMRMASRYENSGISHALQGHVMQILWGDSSSAPEGSGNDGGWGLAFGQYGNPFLKMIANETIIGRSGGTLEARGTVRAEYLKHSYALDITGQNLNNIVEGGFYNGDAMTNAPSGSWWYVQVYRHSNVATDQYVMQVATQLTASPPQQFIRIKNAGTWSSWVSTTGGASSTLIGSDTNTGQSGSFSVGSSWNTHISNYKFIMFELRGQSNRTYTTTIPTSTMFAGMLCTMFGGNGSSSGSINFTITNLTDTTVSWNVANVGNPVWQKVYGIN